MSPRDDRQPHTTSDPPPTSEHSLDHPAANRAHNTATSSGFTRLGDVLASPSLKKALTRIREEYPDGLPPPWEDPCPDGCHGFISVYVRPRLPEDTEPPPFTFCTRCEAGREAAAKHRRRRSGTAGIGAKACETFASRSPLPHQIRAWAIGMAYARNPSGWLYIHGPRGAGKSTLAYCIANTVLAEGTAVVFEDTADLLDHLRGTFHPDSAVRYDERFNTLREVALLVIDRLGGQSNSAFAVEKLGQLIEHRYRNELPTIIASNAPPNVLATWKDGVGDTGIIQHAALADIQSRINDTELVRHIEMSGTNG